MYFLKVNYKRMYRLTVYLKAVTLLNGPVTTLPQMYYKFKPIPLCWVYSGITVNHLYTDLERFAWFIVSVVYTLCLLSLLHSLSFLGFVYYYEYTQCKKALSEVDQKNYVWFASQDINLFYNRVNFKACLQELKKTLRALSVPRAVVPTPFRF